MGHRRKPSLVLLMKKRSKVLGIHGSPITHALSTGVFNVIIARRTMFAAWLTVGMLPLLLQIRSYMKFVTPHKLTDELVVPVGTARETANIEDRCPVEGIVIAQTWWNVAITHYHSVENGRICHFVMPQYNVHGAYLLGTEKVAPSTTTPKSCSDESYAFEHYFYHGSIGYYAFYEEGRGTYCATDKTAYVRVRGLGTYDANGTNLAEDKGERGYRQSIWYSICGSTWIVYRCFLLRRSYVLGRRYGRRCDRMQEKLQPKAAAVYIQESMRLSAHDATNLHRIAIFYMLLEGVMSDLFLLIAQDGIFAKVQYVSLGYNLSGLLSMLFEMLESMKWLRENFRLLVKRLVFSYESSLLGELLGAGVMQHYLTWINRSDLGRSRPTALAVSYYVWSLVGHGVIMLGLTGFIVSVRVLWALIFIRREHGTWQILSAPCCVDTTLGVHNKMVLLRGYSWENNKLYYTTEALKSFGFVKTVEANGAEYFVFRKVYWFGAPRHDMFVIGTVSRFCVDPCGERPCTGPIGLFDRHLGGPIGYTGLSRPRLTHSDNNKVADGPVSLSVLPSPPTRITTMQTQRALPFKRTFY